MLTVTAVTRAKVSVAIAAVIPNVAAFVVWFMYYYLLLVALFSSDDNDANQSVYRFPLY
jgi:hypothetical protein